MPRPSISVVVPAYQAAATIGTCVRALTAQSLPRTEYEIIVVDDGSADNTAELAHSAGARVLRLSHNMGPGAARNAGVAAAHGSTIVFTDADCEPTPGFVENLTRQLDDPLVGGSKGVYLTRQQAAVARLVQLEYEERYHRTARQRSVDFVDTYAACFRRDDILRVGGFDATLRVCEDQDLSFRLAAAGVRVRFVPDARTFHLHADSPGAYFRKKYRTARWKARVVRRYPRKLVHDSHTPPLLKAELVALCAIPIVAVLSRYRRWRPRVWLSIAAYVAMTAPFLLRVAHRDRRLLLQAPAFLVGRDVALAVGFALGCVETLLET
jgi:glycosyltransferase involved in cell wall biosynthesis